MLVLKLLAISLFQKLSNNKSDLLELSLSKITLTIKGTGTKKF